jgi:hypothetical protein
MATSFQPLADRITVKCAASAPRVRRECAAT